MDRFAQNTYNHSKVPVYADSIRRKEMGFALAFAVGMGLGLAFFCMKGVDLISEGKLPAAYEQNNIASLSGLELNSEDLFEYVLGERTGQCIMLLICAAGFASAVLAYAILGYAGFEAGIIVFAFIYQYGFRGLLFFVMLLVPQWLFYAAAFFLLFGIYPMNKQTGRLIWVKRTAVVAVLWFMGALTEIYINSGIIKYFASFF